MRLTAEESHLLDGGQGEVLAQLMREQLTVGEFFGAERFVPVTNAHFTGDPEVLGTEGVAYLERLAATGLRVTVPTTRNSQAVDFEHAVELAQHPDLLTAERRVRQMLATLGVATLNTCIGYQSVYQPHLGEHVAWGDTGTVAYANSVLGARTNYESGTAGIAAGLTGRTPEYGFHLDAVRRANVRVRIRAALDDVADWGAVGAIVGERCRGYWNVPVFELSHGLPHQDELKHLGASLASFGSSAMYHVVGVTPEAPDLATAVGGRDLVDDFEVTDQDIEAVFARDLAPRDVDVDVVVFTGPQLSFFELKRIAEALDGRTVSDGVRLLLTTNSMIRRALEDQGLLQVISAAGGTVIEGTCWYLMDPAAQREQFGWTRLVTNSAKLVNIIQAHGYAPVLRRTEACLQAALSGKVPAP
ncbi:MAG: DUF521 domain-containing protein [Actinobacteria bacterium]|nr:DUF521 domain-containing protein [Actinomycetota bacterium]